jgi:cathepsin L
MKIYFHCLVLALAFSNLALGNAASTPHTHYSFDEFLSKFEKNYDTLEEYNRRKAIFLSNLSKIQSHNYRHPIEHSYTLGINQFADVLEEELPMGLDKSLHPSYALAGTTISETRHLRSAPSFVLESHLMHLSTDSDIDNLPESVDWRLEESLTTAVKNQGMCGSCWAFAATAALESHIAIQTGKLFDLSVQELVSCAPNPNWCGGRGGCTGSTAELAYEFVSQHGMLEEWSFAYQSFNGAKVNCTVLKDDKGNKKMVEGAGGFI